MASLHQTHVAAYHRAVQGGGHHPVHDMFLFHRDWHMQNDAPLPPHGPNRDWGRNASFGEAFLQMHHEMLNAADGEPRTFMHHASLVAWYQKSDLVPPAPWDPLDPIPPAVGYEPDLAAFPKAIRQDIMERAASRNVHPEVWLTRTTDQPGFALPAYFTRQGVDPGMNGCPYTGASRLADFVNLNQLGCSIFDPHNDWHSSIGGALQLFASAIADPAFYFLIHRAVDAVFLDYKKLEVERKTLSESELRERHALPNRDRTIPASFSDDAKKKILMWMEQRACFRGPR